MSLATFVPGNRLARDEDEEGVVRGRVPPLVELRGEEREVEVHRRGVASALHPERQLGPVLHGDAPSGALSVSDVAVEPHEWDVACTRRRGGSLPDRAPGSLRGSATPQLPFERPTIVLPRAGRVQAERRGDAHLLRLRHRRPDFFPPEPPRPAPHAARTRGSKMVPAFVFECCAQRSAGAREIGRGARRDAGTVSQLSTGLSMWPSQSLSIAVADEVVRLGVDRARRSRRSRPG